MPEGNTVEIGENGNKIGPDRPEHHRKQGDHHQHGDAQRLLVNLLQRDGRLFLRLRALGPFFHLMLTTRDGAAIGDAAGRHAQAAQHGLIEQVPDDHQIDRFNPASGQAQRGIEVARCRQHHQRQRNDRQHGHGGQTNIVGLFITPAVATHRPHQDRNQQQVQQDDQLAQHVIHQMQRGKLRDNRPEVQRQQRQADAHDLTTPVAGQLRWHVEMTHRHAVFFQYLPAQAKHQPEQRQFFTERPQQIADVELHSEQNQTHSQNNQAHRQGANKVNQNRFWRMELAIVAQLPYFGGQLRLVFFQPAQTPADKTGNQQQRQTGQESNHYRRPGFLPVYGDLHALNLRFQRLREGFNPVPVHRLVAVYPENLLGQDLLQTFRDAHQLLLVDLQINGHHQLVTQLFIELVQQLATHIHDLEQRVVHFRVHVAGMPLFNFGDKGIALKKGIALLVDVKLLQT